jgi:hypothetical protein
VASPDGNDGGGDASPNGGGGVTREGGTETQLSPPAAWMERCPHRWPVAAR